MPVDLTETKMSKNSLNTRREMKVDGNIYHYYSLSAAEEAGAGPVTKMPRSLKVLYEGLLRHEDGIGVNRDDLMLFSEHSREVNSEVEVLYYPSRLMLVDSSGVPLLADLAALREAMLRNGGDPMMINPAIPCELVIDHSVMVDFRGSPDALDKNMDLEYSRNSERYQFLRWAEKAFKNFKIVPPGVGICHQVNLEALARGIWTEKSGDYTIVAPETLLGMDSHTPMINCLGILGWGVGGLEGGAAMLGMPVSMIFPRVVGCRLSGALKPGVTATDLVLTLTKRLREYGVVAAFVEFFGPGLESLKLSDRATLANMAPEYGATMGYFPIDDEMLRYLEKTGRGEYVSLIRAYAKEQGLWHDPDAPQPVFNEVVEFDMSAVAPSIAGPNHPHNHTPLPKAKSKFEETILPACGDLPKGGVPVDGADWTLAHGDLAIAAISSCTNTSNPAVMIAAGLLARNAVQRGITVKPWVKTSLTPGSRVVADYLKTSGLQTSLDQLGYQVAGFGCTTCMGNSGPLAKNVEAAVKANDVAMVAVLSGNRNFDGRIHPLARANFICSPPLVIAYALAGSMCVDITSEPLGNDRDGNPVMLADIWPDPEELSTIIDQVLVAERYTSIYKGMFDGDARWQAVDGGEGTLFKWPDDTYMKRPPFFNDIEPVLPKFGDIRGARPLAIYGDGITTDHISPVGTITESSAAGQYLIEQGVKPADFNSFAARRVNHDVMIRGTFANIHIQNQMVPDRKGGWARHEPSAEIMPVHEIAERYRDAGVEPIIIAGREYGQGSSRDWAAKGTRILGVRAVIAQGFERIHRSNLVGMGVLPLQFEDGTSWTSLGLDGTETYDVTGVDDMRGPRAMLNLTIHKRDGSTCSVPLLCRLDTPLEFIYFLNGGILHYAVRNEIAPEQANALPH
jgi:aconitate hydratase